MRRGKFTLGDRQPHTYFVEALILGKSFIRSPFDKCFWILEYLECIGFYSIHVFYITNWQGQPYSTSKTGM